MSGYAIEISNLRYAYPAGEVVLDIPQWHVDRASSTFLRGPSGAGKSTLLSILCGLLVPQSGDVIVCGTDLGRAKSALRDRFRAKEIGVVYQRFNLVPYLSVEDNLRVAVWFANNRKRFDPETLLGRLGLPPNLMSRPVAALSVGQQQRVAIARALINRPSLLLADEPTSALDSDARDAFIALLLEQASMDHTTVVFASHDMALSHHFDRVEDLLKLNRKTANRPNDAA